MSYTHNETQLLTLISNINNQFNALSNTYALKTELSTGANVGTGTGQVFRDKTANTINFKTLTPGAGITITNNADDIVITCALRTPIGKYNGNLGSYKSYDLGSIVIKNLLLKSKILNNLSN